MKETCLHCRLNKVKYPKPPLPNRKICAKCLAKLEDVSGKCLLCKKNPAEYLGCYCMDCMIKNNWKGEAYDNGVDRRKGAKEDPDIFF